MVRSLQSHGPNLGAAGHHIRALWWCQDRKGGWPQIVLLLLFFVHKSLISGTARFLAHIFRKVELAKELFSFLDKGLSGNSVWHLLTSNCSVLPCWNTPSSAHCHLHSHPVTCLKWTGSWSYGRLRHYLLVCWANSRKVNLLMFNVRSDIFTTVYVFTI